MLQHTVQKDTKKVVMPYPGSTSTLQRSSGGARIHPQRDTCRIWN